MSENGGAGTATGVAAAIAAALFILAKHGDEVVGAFGVAARSGDELVVGIGAGFDDAARFGHGTIPGLGRATDEFAWVATRETDETTALLEGVPAPPTW